MSQGPDWANGGPAQPYGQPAYPGSQPTYDPVTGQPLPPGPPAYSAVDPYAPPPAQPAYPYPPAAPGYGYPPPPGYQLVPMYPMMPQRPAKPGGAVAAAVLAFIQAGFVLTGGLVMFTGAQDLTNGFSDFGNGSGYSSELAVVAALTVLAGALLIAGGTTMLNRRSTLLVAGGGLSIAISVYFVIRLSDVAFGIGVWVPVLYAVMPVISIALSMGSEVRSWMRTRTADAR